jgi:hypothetical protein
MSVAESIEALEDRFFGELEEDRAAIISELKVYHEAALAKGVTEFRNFSKEVLSRFGGAYIPYIFWVELSEYTRDHENRTRLYDIIREFSESSFEEEETKKMKPLLITYFSMEKEFELDKIRSLILDKTHPAVQEFFKKLLDFSEKNKTSTEMYLEKFQIIHHMYPDFNVLKMPVVKIKELLAD